MNETTELFMRETIKDLLAQCTAGQQGKFRQMYDFKKKYILLSQLVDNMPIEKLDWAMSQCENQIVKNNRSAIE